MFKQSFTLGLTKITVVEGSGFLSYIISEQRKTKARGEKKNSLHFVSFPRTGRRGDSCTEFLHIYVQFTERFCQSGTHIHTPCTQAVINSYSIYTEEGEKKKNSTHSHKHTLSLGRANIHACQVEQSILAENTGCEHTGLVLLCFLKERWCSPIKGSHLSAPTQSTLTLFPRKRHPWEPGGDGGTLREHILLCCQSARRKENRNVE